MTKPNSAFWNRPVSRMITNSVASSPLNGVNTFARRICAMLRPVSTSARFTRPAATRSATSAALRPVAEIVLTTRPPLPSPSALYASFHDARLTSVT